MINLLVNKPNQEYKCRTKYWFKINDDSHGVYGLVVQLDLRLQC